MEGEKILYFYLKEGERWKKHGWSRGKMAVEHLGMEEGGMLGCCGVPEFCRKNRAWKEDRLRDAMGRTVEEQKAEEFYLQPQLALLAGVEEKLPPEVLLKKVLGQVPCMEYLVYIGGGGGKEARGKKRSFGKRGSSYFISCPLIWRESIILLWRRTGRKDTRNLRIISMKNMGFQRRRQRWTGRMGKTGERSSWTGERGGK